MATTPLQVAKSSVDSLLQAPRSLKLAVNCRFSNFRKICAPVICERVLLSTQGVFSRRLNVVQADHGSIVRKNGEICWLMCGEFHTCKPCK
jgi:hypothetical protein